MKLGIKTTDGVSKLKLKTADGISKAVPCACCDPCSGLWGPGYDDWPDALNVSYLLVWNDGQYSDQCSLPVTRISKCVWQLRDSTGYLFFQVSYIQNEAESYNQDLFFGPLFNHAGPYFRIDWRLAYPGSFEDDNAICAAPSAFFFGIKSITPFTPIGEYQAYNQEELFETTTVTITAAS